MAGVVVDFLRSFAENLLADEPVIVVARAAYKREFAGKRTDRVETFDVFFAIERHHVESLIGAPYELLAEVGTLQVGIDFRHPLLCGDRRKHVKQFFFVLCHN